MRRPFVRWWMLALTLSACGTPTDDVVDSPDPGADLQAAFPVQGVDAAGFLVTLQGHLGLGSGAAADEVHAFLAGNAAVFGFRADLADLVLDREVQDVGGTTLRYHQFADGIPVFEGEVVAGLDPAGALIHVRSDYDRQAATLATAPAISAADAVRVAGAELGVAIPRGAAPELVIVRGDKRAPGSHLAWKVAADVRSPRGDFLVFVEAAGGAVVRVIDMMKSAGAACTPCNPATDSGCGRLFHDNPVDLTDDTSLRDTSNVDSSQVGCVLGGLTSGTDLTGTYVNTSITNAPRAAPPYNFLRSANEPFVDEVTVYYHLDRAHQRLAALGYPAVMSFSINTDAHDPTLGENAHYVPSGKYLEFGVGGVDDALDPDVAYHEYGHAIQDNQVPGYGTVEEGGAAGEGFGDYWSVGITDNSFVPVLGVPCIGTWDATAYLPYTGAPGTGCLRRLDGTKQYPRDQDFEVHDDGEMWSAALWRLRGVLGADITDGLVIKSHTFLTTSARFINLADAVQSADAALYGGAHAAAIDTAFKTGGIPRTGTAGTASGTISNTAFSCGITTYANLAYKECTYTQPGALWMRFHFSAFNTEAGWDFAYVSDANFRQVQALSGNLGASTTAVVNGDTIVLRFKADTTITKPGFTIDRVEYRQGCTGNAQCSDGNACNGAEVCSAGLCVAGTPPVCSDGTTCTTDSCNPASGCVYTPVANGTSCANGDACDGTETCQAGACTAGTPPSCDDANVCTADACDAALGCTHPAVADGTACGDGNVCNGAETCVAGGCAAGTPLSCDDGDACTADACDPLLGCTHTPTSCPAACSYDGPTGTITVTMSGIAGTLSISAGNIMLGATTCGTLTNTDSIVVNGTGALTVRGDYVPGRTPEITGSSEIEFTINTDIITFDAAGGNDTLTIGSTGADLNSDGDQDVVMSGAQTKITYKGGNGNDTLDASATTSRVNLYGGAGTDHLIGGSGGDYLYGDADADTLEGNAGNDNLYGGAGNDVELGGAGADIFREDATANGADTLDGGTEADTLYYGLRTAAVTVTLGDSVANDGESGENDAPVAVERVTGGAGADMLVGDAVANLLRGGGGNDTLRGGAAGDTLYGDAGDDSLDGEAGPDKMYGGTGNDTLVGDATAIDTFTCDAGDDTVVGNTDGRAETVSCGDGVDTVQGNGEDTFTACEVLTP